MTDQPNAPDRVTPGDIFVDYRATARRWGWLLGAIAALVLLLGGGYLVRGAVSSPAPVVRAYLAALADRDLSAALETVAPEVAEPADHDIVEQAVLESPDYLPPSGVEIGGARVDGREAVVTARYTVDGQEHATSLRLRRADDLRDRLWPRWLLVDAFGSIRLDEAPERILVNGHPVSAYDRRGTRVLPALPGGYRLAVPADDPVWQERSVMVPVRPQDDTEASLPMVARPEVHQDLTARIEALVDGCAASAELVPAGCPFGYAALGSAEDVQWRIESYPRIGLTAGQEAGAPVLVVHTSQEGEALVTGTRRFGGGFEERVPIPVSGTATIRGGTVSFQPGW